MLDFFISPAHAAAEAATPGIMDFAFPIVLLVLFYFMLIRPQSKRAKEHRNMQGSLDKGDEVVTDGGLMGKIISIGDIERLLTAFVDDRKAIIHDYFATE